MKRKTMAAPKVCRVCLASDLTMYRVVNTELEETYEHVTGEKLQYVGRPVTLCFICVSQLHRCGKFARAAQDANEALDQWYKNRTDNLNLTERPLLSLIKTSTQVVDFISNGIQDVEVKQEITTDDTNEINTSCYEDTFHIEENIKTLFGQDHENDDTCVPNKVNDDINLSNQNEFSTFTESLIDINDLKQEMSDDENYNIQLSERYDIQYEIIKSEGYDESNCGSDDEYLTELTTSTRSDSSKAKKVRKKKALTAAERARRYREKLKETPGKYENYKKKQLMRAKNVHKTTKHLSEEEKIKLRKKWRENKKKQILKNKEKQGKAKRITTSPEKAKTCEKLKKNREKIEVKISRKKIHELTDEEKEMKRKKWREAKERRKIKNKPKEKKIKHKITAAERSKRYRDKLKQNPEKFEEVRIKHLTHIKNTRKKINELTEEEKKLKRKQWREEKKQRKYKKKENE